MYSIGAKWNKRLKCFAIPRKNLSMEIIGAIGSSVTFAMAVRTALSDILTTLSLDNVLNTTLKEVLNIPLDTVLEDLEGYALSSFRPIGKGSTAARREAIQAEHNRALTEQQIGQLDSITPKEEDKPKEEGKQKEEDKPKSFTAQIKESISVNPKLTKEQYEALKNEYIENVSLSIKNFTDAQTIELRNLVEKNTREGLNNTTLVKEIQKRFNVTLSKAKFLARNETELFTAKFYELQCRKLGITQYKWLATGDERVRPMHKVLAEESKKGAVYRFDDPPVTDIKGNKHNPGEDYNCRCVAAGVLSV